MLGGEEVTLHKLLGAVCGLRVIGVESSGEGNQDPLRYGQLYGRQVSTTPRQLPLQQTPLPDRKYLPWSQTVNSICQPDTFLGARTTGQMFYQSSKADLWSDTLGPKSAIIYQTAVASRGRPLCLQDHGVAGQLPNVQQETPMFFRTGIGGAIYSPSFHHQ